MVVLSVPVGLALAALLLYDVQEEILMNRTPLIRARPPGLTVVAGVID